MIMLWAATVALAIAIVADWKGLGPKWIGDRAAAVLALFAFSVFVAGTPLGGWFVGLGNGLAGLLSRATRTLDPTVSLAISQGLVPLIVLVIGLAWVFAMLPHKASNHVGDVATLEMNSSIIWGGALVLTVGASLVPGTLGDFLRTVLSLGVSTGHSLIAWAV